MNCRPGDLAMVVHPTLFGRLVNVMYAAPVGRNYVLPDGFRARRDGPNCFVCESLGPLFDAPVNMEDGSTTRRLTRYASIQDRWLKPLRDPGDDASDESLSWCHAPEKVTA